MVFKKSMELRERFHARIPGGAHTYAKGDDQYPENMAPIIASGQGCLLQDVDGNEFIEFGAGLRAVTLGHAYPSVVAAAHAQMLRGNNFVRPAALELECAEEFLGLVTGAEMVKFGKNGSDAVSAAVRISRAYTGRDLIAVCAQHPFFSVDDWFIGTTPMSAGIPSRIQEMTVKFNYNDPDSLRSLFDQYPGQIACVILEPEKDVPPQGDFLQKVKELCHANGAVFVLDEMICGFRWHNGGGQAYHNVVPDLATFGKGMGNGFSISALAGTAEIMKLGGWMHDRERVFLLSLTHGAEGPSLGAALETMRIYGREPVVQTMWDRGERLVKAVERSIAAHHLEGHVALIGRPCNLVYATRDHDRKPSQPFRTLFLQETISRGLLAPSLVVNYSHTEEVIDRTAEIIDSALVVYRKALDEGVEKYLVGRPVQPVFRKYH